MSDAFRSLILCSACLEISNAAHEPHGARMAQALCLHVRLVCAGMVLLSLPVHWIRKESRRAVASGENQST